MVTAFAKLLRNAVQHNFDQGLVRVREVTEIPGHGGPEEVIGGNWPAELAERPAFAPWQAAGIHWRIIMIYNTGPTIPAERRDALFNKFEIVGRIEHHQKSSGLSLSIVRAVLENHGGKIHVESRESDGNYFYLVIPAMEREAIAKVVAQPLGDQQGQGVGGAAGDEEVDLTGDGAGLEVELEHSRS
jgi:signal transduction histidine kinase